MTRALELQEVVWLIELKTAPIFGTRVLYGLVVFRLNPPDDACWFNLRRMVSACVVVLAACLYSFCAERSLKVEDEPRILVFVGLTG